MFVDFGEEYGEIMRVILAWEKIRTIKAKKGYFMRNYVLYSGMPKQEIVPILHMYSA